jgi:hypothetical protein
MDMVLTVLIFINLTVKNGLTIIAIGWTRGNKKALATIIATQNWQKFRALQ